MICSIFLLVGSSKTKTVWGCMLCGRTDKRSIKSPPLPVACISGSRGSFFLASSAFAFFRLWNNHLGMLNFHLFLPLPTLLELPPPVLCFPILTHIPPSPIIFPTSILMHFSQSSGEKKATRVSPFLAWGDFHARSRFARSTIPEKKWGTTRSQ